GDEIRGKRKSFSEGVTVEGILRFGKQGKLSPRYIRPYEILERVGPLAYRLALPAELSQIHDVFHVLGYSDTDLTLVIFCVNRR
ncbi:UNVERIFIED_CONTAM: hypothetical protein Sangu_2771400, partial [Sesamum angustifolium]